MIFSAGQVPTNSLSQQNSHVFLEETTPIFINQSFLRCRDPDAPLKIDISLVSGPLTVTVTTRIFTFLVGDSYKPLFATVIGKGPHPTYPLKIDGWKNDISSLKMVPF